MPPHRRAGIEVTTQLVIAFITASLDHCNSVRVGLPKVTLEPLQHVQNAAVRLILELNMRDHVTPSLIQLHWLPVRCRIQFKLCSITRSIYTSIMHSIWSWLLSSTGLPRISMVSRSMFAVASSVQKLYRVLFGVMQ